VRYPNAEAYTVAESTPLVRQLSNSVTHFKRHEHGLSRGVLDWHRIVEDHHYTVTGVAFERAAIFDDFIANGRMIVAQQGHHVFGVCALCEAREPAQISEECGYLSAMAFELLLATRRHDQISHLRRQEAPQPAHALDFAYLVGNALFELLV
jgi:hypothetical protein